MNKLLKSSFVFSFFTFLSRIFGLVREVIFALMFGATGNMDAFLVAFKIPNFFRRLFAEGAFNQAFVPILAEYSEDEQGHNELKAFIAAISGLLGLACFAVVIIGIFSSNAFVHIFAPGFANNSAQLLLASDLLKVTFPYLGFITLTALSSSILNIYGKFGLPAFTPVLLNIILIIFSLYISPHYANPVMILAYGVLLAGIAQFLFLLPALYKVRCLVLPNLNFKNKGAKRVFKQLIPACFGASVTQINLLMDTVFASFLVSGSISWLYYSNRLVQFPLGVFGVALSTVILPTLSKQYVNKNKIGFKNSLNWGCEWVFLIAIPCSVGLICLAKPLVITLFYRGAFTSIDAYNTSYSLMAFSGGLLFFMMTKVLVSVYYSQKNIKTPVICAFIAVVINILLNIIWIKYFKHVGVALAASFAAFVDVFLLWRGLVKIKVIDQYFSWDWIKYCFNIFLASAIMGLVLWFFTPNFGSWLEMYWYKRFMNLIGLIAIGASVYVSVMGALGFDWGRALNSNEDMNKYVNKDISGDVNKNLAGKNDISPDIEGNIDRD